MSRYYLVIWIRAQHPSHKFPSMAILSHMTTKAYQPPVKLRSFQLPRVLQDNFPCRGFTNRINELTTAQWWISHLSKHRCIDSFMHALAVQTLHYIHSSLHYKSSKTWLWRPVSKQCSMVQDVWGYCTWSYHQPPQQTKSKCSDLPPWSSSSITSFLSTFLCET